MVVGSSPTAGALRPGHAPGHFSLIAPKAALRDTELRRPIHPRTTQPRRASGGRWKLWRFLKPSLVVLRLPPRVLFRRDAHRLIGLNPFRKDAWEVTDAPSLRNRFHNHCLYFVRGTWGTGLASPRLAFPFVK